MNISVTRFAQLGFQGDMIQLSELNNASLPMPLDISKHKNAEDIRKLFKEGKRVGKSTVRSCRV